MKEEKTFGIDKSSKFFISIIGIVVIFIVLKELQTIFIPFIIAYFLFFVFKPINDYLIRKKVPYSIAIILDLLIIVFVIGGIASIITQSFTDLGAQLPEYEKKLNHVVSSTAASWRIDEPALKNFNADRFLKSLDYGGIAEGFFSSTFSALGSFLFIVFFFIFINTGHKHILESIENYFANENDSSNESSDEKSKFSVEETANNITDKIQKYLVGKFLLSLLIGFIYAVILWLFGVDFFIVWGTITFLLNFVPNIGSLISAALPALMSLVQFESFGYTLIIILVLVIAENITGNFIEPKVFGSSLGLNPLIILLSFLLWGYIWGVVGAILSIPLTSIFKIIIANSRSNKLKFLHELLDNK
jgi:predicted PurR-regulated permease PerM